MRTSIRPASRAASFSKVSSDRSISRPVSSVGPRSSTLHDADAPLWMRVTLIIVPIGRVRWAQVAAGALNHDATPLSVLVTAPLTAAAGGTTAATMVVRGVSGVIVAGGGAIAGEGAGLGDVVVVVGFAVVVVVAGFLVVVVVGRGRVVDVVGRGLSATANSCSEIEAAAGAGVWGASSPAGAGTAPAAEPTRMAVEESAAGRRRDKNPATRVT